MTDFALTDYYLQVTGTAIAVILGDDGQRVVGLYKNDFTPVPGSDIGDLVEADFTGYDRQECSNSQWLSGLVAHESVLTAPETVTFSATGGAPQTVYGYFVYYVAEGQVLWIQRFAEPQVVQVGVPLIMTPRLRLKNCFDTGG